MSAQILEATFLINTPMYIGSADQVQAELSTKAIKSAIRFWWRTLNYPKFQGDLANLHREECKHFGSTEKVSPLRFMVMENSLKQEQGIWKRQKLTYLKGLGLRPMKGEPERKYLDSEQEFTLRVVSKTPIDESVKDAIKMFGLLGALGSRALRGFGSVQLLELKTNGKSITGINASSESDYRQQLLALSGSAPQASSAIPSTAHSRIDFVVQENSAEQVMATFDKAFHSYRTNSNTGFENFKKDCDWFLGRPVDQTDFHPERAVFGLPHNYFVKLANGKTLGADVKPADFERRQSPLHFHVHKVGGRYFGVLIYFKSDFLPAAKDKIEMSWTGRKPHGNTPREPYKVKMMSTEKQYGVIADFMSGERRPQGKEPQATLLDTKKVFEDGQPVEVS